MGLADIPNIWAEMEEQDQDLPEETQFSSLSQGSPAQKRWRTPKVQIGKSLVNGLNWLIDLQANALGQSQSGQTLTSQISDQEVSQIKSQVSQLQTDVAEMNIKMNRLLDIFMQQQSSDAPP